LSIAALGAVSLYGQTNLAGPGSGFIFDAPTEAVLPVHGSVGATALGDPVLNRVQFASISPSGNHAVACRRGDCFITTDLTSADATKSPVASTPEGVAWAPDGSSAVLYSLTRGWLQLMSGLATTIETGPVWTVPGPGPLLAVTYDGQHTIVATGGETGGVYGVSSVGGMVRLADIPSANALLLGSDVVYVLDAGSPSVVRVPLQGGPPERWNLALNDPVALQFGTDGARQSVLYVSGGADHALLALDPQTGVVNQRTDLSFSPSLLYPLPGGSLLLTSRIGPDSVLWSFAPGRGAFFIPAPPPAEDVPLTGRRR
jgi:hypothetical protein